MCNQQNDKANRKHSNVQKNPNKKCHEVLLTVTNKQQCSNLNDKGICFDSLL